MKECTVNDAELILHTEKGGIMGYKILSVMIKLSILMSIVWITIHEPHSVKVDLRLDPPTKYRPLGINTDYIEGCSRWDLSRKCTRYDIYLYDDYKDGLECHSILAMQNADTEWRIEQCYGVEDE